MPIDELIAHRQAQAAMVLRKNPRPRKEPHSRGHAHEAVRARANLAGTSGRRETASTVGVGKRKMHCPNRFGQATDGARSSVKW